MSRNRTMERRFVTSDFEVRRSGNRLVIEGYAALFGVRSQDLGGFVEEIESGSFNKTLKEADIRALQNHDPNLVLGRNVAGTLDLSADSRGLHYRITPPNTSYAVDLAELLERRDVDQSSFAGYFLRDDWGMTERDYPLRSVKEVALVDVSVVTYPAYPDTTSGLSDLTRGAIESWERRAAGIDLHDIEAVKRALAELHEVDEAASKQEDSPQPDKAAWAREELAKAIDLANWWA